MIGESSILVLVRGPRGGGAGKAMAVLFNIIFTAFEGIPRKDGYVILIGAVNITAHKCMINVLARFFSPCRDRGDYFKVVVRRVVVTVSVSSCWVSWLRLSYFWNASYVVPVDVVRVRSFVSSFSSLHVHQFEPRSKADSGRTRRNPILFCFCARVFLNLRIK